MMADDELHMLKDNNTFNDWSASTETSWQVPGKDESASTSNLLHVHKTPVI